MKKIRSAVSLVALMLAVPAWADNLSEITIYNQDLALVKKSQKLELKKGVNEVIFKEVAEQMKPESVFIYGKGVRVLEQNYDYQGVSQYTLLNANVGKKVKTVRQNPSTGENIFKEAILLAVDGGTPILKFDYGIETNFKGQVLFSEIPPELNSSPILMAKVETKEEGDKDLGLAYLSSGFNWAANYVAKINDKETLSLLGRAAITNNSGSGYQQAKVNLIAGDINVVRQVMQPRPMLKNTRGVMLAASMADGFAQDAVINAPSTMDSYYVYQIPEPTTLKNGQIKQISFLSVPAVKYQKEGVLQSSLYFGLNKNAYKDVHPSVLYHFTNDVDSGLGMPLPQGKISFYAPDKEGSLQFIGENMMSHKAEGEKVSSELGKFFDVYGKGEIVNLTKVDEKQYQKTGQKCPTVDTKYHYDVVYEVTNKSQDTVHIVLKQPLMRASVIKETLKGESEGNIYQWKFDVLSGESQKIEAEVVNEFSNTVCP